jgi:hypothetical protein
MEEAMVILRFCPLPNHLPVEIMKNQNLLFCVTKDGDY